MCCGSTESTPATAGVTADPQGPAPDDQRYRVSYFNGTTQDVTGIDEVRRVLLNPEARAEGTDRDGFQGGSYARIN
jgi:hypothetical protein